MHRPTFDEFAALAAEHTVVPVYRRLIGDTLTPVTAFCTIQEGDWSFLFESVVGGERVGRYSFLGSGPFLRFEAHGTRVRILEAGQREAVELTHPDPLRLLEERLARYRAPTVPGLPRFCGGAVGYAGYDTVRYVENLPNAPTDDRGLPDLAFAFHDRMVIFDHITKTIAAVAHAHVDPSDLEGCYRTACGRVASLASRSAMETTGTPNGPVKFVGVPRSATSDRTRGSSSAVMESADEPRQPAMTSTSGQSEIRSSRRYSQGPGVAEGVRPAR